MNIKDRIRMHHEAKDKLRVYKERIERKLDRVNGKIGYHLTAIQNLERKQTNGKKDDV